MVSAQNHVTLLRNCRLPQQKPNPSYVCRCGIATCQRGWCAAEKLALQLCLAPQRLGLNMCDACRFLFVLGHLLRFGTDIIEDADPPNGGGSHMLADCHAMCLSFFTAASSAPCPPQTTVHWSLDPLVPRETLFDCRYMIGDGCAAWSGTLKMREAALQTLGYIGIVRPSTLLQPGAQSALRAALQPAAPARAQDPRAAHARRAAQGALF